MQHTQTIEVNNLSRFFGQTAALEKVSFTAAAGEAVFFVGGNGAGKSTLLSILAGILAPSEGDVRLFGRLEKRRSKASRAVIGFAGAEPYLYRDFTIEESLRFFAECYPGTGAEARVETVLQELDLAASRRRHPRECSQGVVRRASLARAFLHSPELLILDEPLTNLDSAAKSRLIELLRREKNRGATLVIASHEEELVRALADRVCVLHTGRLLRSVGKAEIGNFSFGGAA